MDLKNVLIPFDESVTLNLSVATEPSRWWDGAESLGMERTSCLWLNMHAVTSGKLTLGRNALQSILKICYNELPRILVKVRTFEKIKLFRLFSERSF